MKHEKEYHIDVDIIIDKFELKYPHLRPPTRKSIAKLVNTRKQILSDWKHIRTPRFAYFLLDLMKFEKVPLKKFITKVGDKWVVDVWLFVREVNKIRNSERRKPISVDDVSESTSYSTKVFYDWLNKKSPNLAYKILKLEELAEDDFTTFIVEKK